MGKSGIIRADNIGDGNLRIILAGYPCLFEFMQNNL
jgi:hypothetical protein